MSDSSAGFILSTCALFIILNICVPGYGEGMRGGLYKKKKKIHVGVKEIKQVGDYGKGKGCDPDPVCPN